MSNLAYRLESTKPFGEITEALKTKSQENMFRVLAVHDVQETLKEKGFERGPLEIIEVCNASFAHEALNKDVSVAMFMPCKFTVHTEGDKTIVTLARPTMIAEMLPDSGIDELAGKVEETLKKVMESVV